MSVLLVQPPPADHQSMADRAYRRIREAIITLELPPGSVISESDLQSRLGFGRTPIREALRTLAGERLIEVYPRRGMFVAGVDARDLRAVSEVREQLEPFAARLAAQRRTPEQVGHLTALIADLDALGADPSSRALIELDQRSHQQVYACAHNDFLVSVLDEHYVHALRIWLLALDRVPNLPQAVAEHRAILAAIRDSDPDRAAMVMGAHVRDFEAKMRQWL
ncbi:MAG: GntR family transcriptional regulator [Actinomycetales bacterium]|nr:GntR family transcriptional regulator [Actinomycetales bacterium]